MITENKTDDGNTTYTVRVFLKSRQNSALRITRQKKGFRNRPEAEREEARMKKECERELSQTEARGTLFCDLLDEWYEHATRTKVVTGKSSKVSLDDYLGSTKKWFKDYLKRPAADLNPYAIAEIFEHMTAKGMSLGHQKKIK